jgi:anion-transporting  ArsA/GET3 family ATPase
MADILDKRLVFVTGKGGVGKTTVAAALGLVAARAGKRTIVCEVAQQERMSSVFRREGVGYSETQLETDLYAMSIDPQESMDEYLRSQVKSPMYALLFDNRFFQYFAAATPGMRELVTIGKIWELAQFERRNPQASPYDLVIVDAPSTGHGLAFLGTPRTFRDTARVGPISRQAGKIDAFISDSSTTGVVAVALPEEMPVNETAALEHDLLNEVGVAVDRVYLNGLYPERFKKAEAEKLAQVAESENGAAKAAARAALSEYGRAKTQRTQLNRLKRGVEAPVKSLPFLFEPELDVEAARKLAGKLG